MKHFIKLLLVLALTMASGFAQTVTTYSTSTNSFEVTTNGFFGTNIVSGARYVYSITIQNPGSRIVTYRFFDTINKQISSTNSVSTASQAITAAASTGGTQGTSPLGVNPTDTGIERTIATTYSSVSTAVVRPAVAYGTVAALTTATHTFTTPILISGLAVTNDYPVAGALLMTVTHSPTLASP